MGRNRARNIHTYAHFYDILRYATLTLCLLYQYTDIQNEKQGNSKDTAEKEGMALSTTSNTENEEKAKHEHKKDKKIKMVTRDKNLLLACSYFDLNHSGYIETKDAEDILLSLNLNFSRAQVNT